MAINSLTEKYRKWDILDDSDDELKEEIIKHPTQYDFEGDDKINIKDIIYLNNEEITNLTNKLQQNKKEIWQIVIRKLRVWTASSKENNNNKDHLIPCRPYCILINNLYPLGQVMAKEIVDPPEIYPTALTILKKSIQIMNNPPMNVPRHRPDKIVFPDKVLAGELRKTYASIGIECSYLSESSGIDEYIKELSSQLISKGIATRGETSEKLGILTGEGVNTHILKRFYETASTFYSLKPWNQLMERQSIQIETTSNLIIDSKLMIPENTKIYASILGKIDRNNESSVTGIAYFFSRADLERRVLPKNQELAYLTDKYVRRCGSCDKNIKENSNIELKKCIRCQIIFYCNQYCQKNDWLSHKRYCIPPDKQNKIDNNSNNNEEIRWSAKEVTVFFSDISTLPFDDLDMIDTNDFEIYNKDQGKNTYPAIVSFHYGKPEIPNAIDIVWSERIMKVFSVLLQENPKYMEESIYGVIGEKPLDSVNIKIKTSSLNNGFTDETLIIRNATVLTLKDINHLRTSKVES